MIDDGEYLKKQEAMCFAWQRQNMLSCPKLDLFILMQRCFEDKYDFGAYFAFSLDFFR
jgi:hypothetical protein